MASASESNLEAVVCAAKDGGLDVREMSGSEDEVGFRCCGRVESEVSDVGL